MVVQLYQGAFGAFFAVAYPLSGGYFYLGQQFGELLVLGCYLGVYVVYLLYFFFVFLLHFFAELCVVWRMEKTQCKISFRDTWLVGLFL